MQYIVVIESNGHELARQVFEMEDDAQAVAETYRETAQEINADTVVVYVLYEEN